MAPVLEPDGVVAFSTMRVGSPAAGRIFKECAVRFGLVVSDPSESLGTEDRCRHVLEEVGFDRLRVMPSRVDFERFDLARLGGQLPSCRTGGGGRTGREGQTLLW